MRTRLGRLLLAAATVGAALGIGQAATAAPRPEVEVASLKLEVDVSERRLYVREGDEVIETYRVAVGRPGNKTPRGNFQVRHIIWNPRWVPPDAAWAKDKKPKAPGDPKNPMGRVKLFFQEPDYYIHGTHEEDSLGRAESRGCVRMRNSDVISLAKLVMEHGGAERNAGWFRRVLNRVRSSEEVWLKRAVPLTIRT